MQTFYPSLASKHFLRNIYLQLWRPGFYHFTIWKGNALNILPCARHTLVSFQCILGEVLILLRLLTDMRIFALLGAKQCSALPVRLHAHQPWMKLEAAPQRWHPGLRRMKLLKKCHQWVPVMYKVLNHKLQILSVTMCPEEQYSQGRPIRYGKFGFCFISIFIRKDNGDKVMHLSSHQSKRRTLAETRVAKVKQVVISVSSFCFFLNVYYLIVISKETNSFLSAWKPGDSNEHKEMFVEWKTNPQTCTSDDTGDCGDTLVLSLSC